MTIAFSILFGIGCGGLFGAVASRLWGAAPDSTLACFAFSTILSGIYLLLKVLALT